MADTAVIQALVRTRAQISGLVAKAQSELDARLSDLRAIDRTLQLSGYTAAATNIPSTRRFVKLNAEALRERCDFLMATMRAAPKPLRCAELTELYREAHNVTATDAHTRDWYRSRVGNALRSLKLQGKAKMEGGGMTAVWSVA